MKRLGAVDLTNGKVMLSILRFSWPIFVGNAFQQLYNVVDTAVLGRYADYCAMASVGLCFPIIVSVIALFCGIGTGTSVIVSRYRGAGENNSIKETILSAWGIVLVGSIPLALLGVWNAEVLLQLAGVHEALIGDAASYLRIYFSVSIAVLGYGINDGILRGLGDSRASLLFLSLSCLINVGLDILLVAGMQLGVVGVAIATVLAELAACILSTGYIFRNYIGKVQSSRARWHTVKNICAIGLPLGLKQMLFAAGVIMVQMVINRCEPSFIAGFNAASKIDMFAALPIQSFSVAMMTFIGQNIGARKEDRIYIGIKEALKLSLMVDVVLVVLIMTFAPQLLRLFNSDPSVIAGGLAYLYRIMPFYVIYTVTSLTQSVLNGLGNVLVSTLIMSGAQWLGRVPAAWLLYKLCSPENIYFCYGIGWIIELSCLVAYIVIGLYGKRLKSKLGETKR